jgi:hypothetical protein
LLEFVSLEGLKFVIIRNISGCVLDCWVSENIPVNTFF